MAYTEAKKRANGKWNRAQDNICIRVPAGNREKWKAAADKMELSLTSFIALAANEKIRRDHLLGDE